MRVCILTTSFPRFHGDFAGNFVFELAKHLVSNGLAVEVIAPHESGTLRHERMDGIEVNRFVYMIPYRWQKIAYLGGIPDNLRRYWLAWAQLPLFFISFFIQGMRAYRRCEVLHAYWVFAGLVASLLSRRNGKPVVLTVQGSDINLNADSAFLRQIRTYVLARVNKIIAVSHPLSERVMALGVTPERVITIPNGVNLGVYPEPASQSDFKYRLMWIGRLSPEKGVNFLTEALSQVVVEFPQTTLTLVGDGPLRGSLEEKIRTLQLTGHVKITGMVSHEEIPLHLAGSDVFVLPSLNEGLPLSMLEAMSAAKPVVASRVGGIPDVMVDNGDKQTGLMVPAGDSVALASAIMALLRSPEEAWRLGRNGRARVETEFVWPVITKKTIALYRTLV